MTGFRICNGTSISGLKVFVSKYTNGNDEWFDLPNNFSDDSKCHWNRNGWEIIVIKNPQTGERRGWYMQTLDNGVLECTFTGFEGDMSLSLNTKGR
ncbi:hypothetical protein BJ165DRAFT_1351947 [Panaeolus papilionaceus]|nr:hypothetical protein BJ165DRAFT_1351947 [Panaeolus papilionaceus]